MAKTEIRAEASLDTTKFQRGLAKSQKSIGKFVKNGIAKFGALAGAAGLGSMAKAAIDLGSKISDMAVQLNIGTTELQVLDFAAREAGVGTDIMARALRNVQLRTEEAIKGNKSYGQAFEQLGINIEEFKKLNTEGKLEAIAVAQANATDKAAAYNAVSRILGEKAGPALQEVLQNLAGPKGYGGLEAAAERAGEVMSKDTIAKMDEAADRIESFKRRMTVLTAEVLTKVVPAFQILGNGLGFVGDVVGVSAANFLAFGSTIGSVLKAVIAPAISQMEALGLAIKAAGQFASRDFAGAKKSIKGAKDQVAETIEAVKDIPEKIGDAFTQLGEDQKTAWEVMGQSIDKRANAITSNFESIAGAAKGATEEIKKTGNAIETDGSGDGATSSSAGGSTAAASTQKFDPADANKSGIVTGREQRAQESAQRKSESEARRAKTLEVAREAGAGERARVADRNQRFDVREAAAGLGTNGIDSPAKKGESLEEQAVKQTEELEKLNKTIGKLESALGD